MSTIQLLLFFHCMKKFRGVDIIYWELEIALNFCWVKMSFLIRVEAKRGNMNLSLLAQKVGKVILSCGESGSLQTVLAQTTLKTKISIKHGGNKMGNSWLEWMECSQCALPTLLQYRTWAQAECMQPCSEKAEARTRFASEIAERSLWKLRGRVKLWSQQSSESVVFFYLC